MSGRSQSIVWRWIHHLGVPQNHYRFAGRLAPWLKWIALIAALIGLYGGLWLAPADYQQGDSFRLIYVHVPAAWMSMFVYVVMAATSAVVLIWRIKVCEAVARASAVTGACFTVIALATGSIWGKPMWGTWWTWDARLTSELILLFLYLGYIALGNAYEDRRAASRAAAILAVVGVINIPIIHFSVEWWNTLHQGATVSKIGKPSIHFSMLWPLLVMTCSFQCYYFWQLMVNVRSEILVSEQRSRWVAAELES
ncbi:heme ABC transporter permease [Gammaproteobacteria bacterium]|nr:heme ABC transporter permease [Gammaproteobacteria bacterium]